MTEKRIYKAIVQKVIASGPHGPYAVASSDEFISSITFSLTKPVWEEDSWPERGTFVALFSLREKRAGWRAQQGRFWEPSDERTKHSRKEQ